MERAGEPAAGVGAAGTSPLGGVTPSAGNHGGCIQREATRYRYSDRVDEYGFSSVRASSYWVTRGVRRVAPILAAGIAYTASQNETP